MARNKSRNTPIGSAPCPFKGCDLDGVLYRYRAQSDAPERARRAGKLYLMCTAHGMTQDQEWLLETATITGPDTPPPANGTDAADPKSGGAVESHGSEPPPPAPEPAPPEPAPPEPAPPTAPGPDADKWGYF